jgi:hypothetical protein
MSSTMTSAGSSRKEGSKGFKQMKDNLLSLMRDLDIPQVEEAEYHKTIKSSHGNNNSK